MKQFKLFKYIRNYFVRLPFRNFYPIYIPLVYVSCAVVTAITVLTNPEMSACTLGQRLIITAVWVLFSPIFAPIALWTYNTLWILTDPFKEAVSEFLHAVKGDKFIESPGEEEFLCTLDLFTSRNLTMEQGKELWYKKHNIKVVEVTEEVDEQTGETSLLPEPKQVYISEEQVADAELLKKREMDMLYQGVLLYNRSLLKYYLNEEQITKFVNNLFDLRESKEPEERIPTLTVVSAEDKICNIATPRKRLSMYIFSIKSVYKII